jgi:3D (Asp-Asp-Asp) domain-containing protein
VKLLSRIATTTVLAAALGGCGNDGDRPMTLEPVVVRSPLVLPGAVVQGASSKWFLNNAPPRYGDPVPVQLTAYCLNRTTTRRGRYVRAGIVAADPRLFPLSRYIELYADGRYLGRFLIDDTGRLIKGNIVDIWMPTCREARQFGRRKGTAVLVPLQPDAPFLKSGKAR